MRPLRRLSLSGGKTSPVSPQRRGCTSLATITKPKCQRCRICSRKHSEARIQFQEENKQKSTPKCSAGPSAAPDPAARARPFRSAAPWPGGRVTGRASTRARGFAAYPRPDRLAESGTGSSSASAPVPAARPRPAAGSEEASEPRAGRVRADAAAAEAVAAHPPPTRPNRRCDARSGANAGPSRRPAAARARRRWGPAPHAARASPPRARYSSRRPAPARAAARQDAPPRARAEAAVGSGRPRS